jgi:DNA-binding winged helix-turn-helix (wHTH) protein/tetratricopeptide (TPR) repeat protein
MLLDLSASEATDHPLMEYAGFRFGDFELDMTAYEVRRKGRRVKVAKQAMELLMLLVEHRGRLVSRDQIVGRLWGKDVFVDVNASVNTAIRKIRQALRDSPEAPAFIETVPGRGYRFIAPIEVVSPLGQSGSLASTPSSAAARDEFQVANTAVTVLPFKILGGVPERQYVADGLTDETASCLARVDPEHLRVKGRTVAYRGTRKTVADIGRELSVDYLVEGSIQVEGTRFRITVTLLRVCDQEHIWSETYERQPSSLLGLQQDLSTAIAEQIRLRLSSNYLKEISRRQTQNSGAYDAYLRGRYFEHQRTPEGNKRAIQYYEQAIALDPNYALAWSSLAFTHAASAINSDSPPCEVGPRARDAASHALRANPNLAETQFVAAYINFLLHWDWKAAEVGFQRAILLDNSNATSFRYLGHTLSQMGRKTDAESAMQSARQLDPLDAMNYALSAQVSFQNRVFSAAVVHARRAIAVNSALWIGYIQLGQAYEQLGEPELALEALADATRLSHGNSKSLSLRGYVAARAKRTAEAREVLQTLQALSRQRYVPPSAMALIHAGLGEGDLAFEALQSAHAAKDIHLIFLPVDPKWDAYRNDPRFQSVLARCGFNSS